MSPTVKNFKMLDIAGQTVEVGQNVEIGQNIKFNGFKGTSLKLRIGNNVRIGDNVKIIANGPIILEDSVTLHDGISIIGKGSCTIGKNTWIAQHTHLDVMGELAIGEDCCIGYNCQIWTHRQRAPQLGPSDYQTLAYPNFEKKTVIGDKVWLLGGLITVSPGIHLASGTVILSNSVVTKSTQPCFTYAGIPAKRQKTRRC